MNEQDEKSLKDLLREVLKSNNADKDYGAIKAGLGLIPGVGGAAVEFFSTYVSSPAEKRLHIFLVNLVEAVQVLEDKVSGFNIESLKENECFITLLIQSLEIARRNHQEEKLNALRNLLLNSAFQDSVEDDIKLVFFDWISDLKVSHLHLLYLLHEPNKVELTTLNKLEANKPFYAYCLKQLIDKRLVFFEGFYKITQATLREEDRLHSYPLPYSFPPSPVPAGMSPSRKQEKRMEVMLRESDGTLRDLDLAIRLIKKNKGESYTTELGKLFIQFIKSPLENS